MEILVLSCDANEDTFYPFHHCMEKYWSNHPKITYKTETIKNPYYDTVCTNYPLSQWTKGVRETLDMIQDDTILIMMDDCFVRNPVDEDRISYACSHLTGNIAMFNFEKSFDPNDEITELHGFKKRKHGSSYEVSIMCGLWNKAKLKQVIAEDTNPWQVEFNQNNCGFDYYINSGDFIIDWGYKTWNHAGICKGKWCNEIIPFFTKEDIIMDFSKRGIV